MSAPADRDDPRLRSAWRTWLSALAVDAERAELALPLRPARAATAEYERLRTGELRDLPELRAALALYLQVAERHLAALDRVLTL